MGDWKLLRNSRRDTAEWELYNLGDDIGETNNLIDQLADRGGALRDVLERLDAEMVDRAF